MTMTSLYSQDGLHPLSGCAGILAFLNNIILLSSPWILGPTEPNRVITAFYMSILFAMVETAYLAAFIWLRVSPSLLILILSPNHLLSTEICHVVYIQSVSLRRCGGDPDKVSAYRAHGDRCVPSDKDEGPHFGMQLVSLAWPATTSAMLDAALLLFAADLTCNPNTHMSSSSAAYTTPFAGFSMYVLARLGDLRMVQSTHRNGLFAVLFGIGSTSDRRLAAALSCFTCLACLFTARTALGWFGSWLTSYPILQLVLLQPTAAVLTFDNIRVENLLEWAGSYSSWLSPILGLISIPLYLAGFYMVRRGYGYRHYA